MDIDDGIDFSGYCFVCDCLVCPYFLQFDICRPEDAANLWIEV